MIAFTLGTLFSGPSDVKPHIRHYRYSFAIFVKTVPQWAVPATNGNLRPS
jgi:hypothetical protein